MAGSHLLALLRDAAMPVVTTMHSLLRDPPEELRDTTRRLIGLSDRIVVMAERAVEILHETYDVLKSMILLTCVSSIRARYWLERLSLHASYPRWKSALLIMILRSLRHVH